MSKQLHIGVLGAGLIGWGGGVDLLRIILGALCQKERIGTARLTLLLPCVEDEQTYGKYLYSGLSALCSSKPLQRLREVYWQAAKGSPKKVARNKILDALIQPKVKLNIKRYKGQDGLTQLVQRQNFDAIIPSMHNLGADFPVPWVGYIADVQHRHLPEQFSPEECTSRDELFLSILESAPAIVVTSQAVKRDIQTFYPGCVSPVFVLPFAPLPLDEWFDNDQTIEAERYGMPPRYFLISSQFWRHKSHVTAIEALALLRQQADFSDVKLVCTGATHDYRHPGYFDELQRHITDLGLANEVIILGHIPKRHQIEIMKKAVALIQPTLFEGSQGGLAVYDAVGLGVRAIVSDIPVNCEIQDPLVAFFQTGSAEDLKRMMTVILNEVPPSIERQHQMQLAQQRITQLGDQLLEAVNVATKHHVKP